MKSKKQTRPYRMTTRADATAQTGKNILDVTIALWRERPVHEITLEAIAERAGVSVRTVLRRYGSKEGVFEACAAHDAADVFAERDKVPAGDVEEALRVLLDDYEKNGDANIRTLAVEEEMEVAHKILQAARIYHRSWCARVFAPYLPDPSVRSYESRLLSFIAATEFYLWKLMRRDLGRSFEETFEAFRLLVNGLISRSQQH